MKYVDAKMKTDTKTDTHIRTSIDTETEKWLEGRTHGIGGSEASIVLGINPWKSRLELWHEKVTKTRYLDRSTQISLKIGNALEPIIAEEYSNITGRNLQVRPQKVHPKYPFILGNIDREIVGDKKGPGILEIKTKGVWTNWHGDDIPKYYITQLQHYLEVYGYKWGSFAVLDLGRMKIDVIDMNRDDKFISSMVGEEIKFWDLVERKTPPAVDDSKACTKFLREYYKDSEDITIDLNDNEEAKQWIERLRHVKNKMKLFASKELECKNHLMSIMGSAERAVGDSFSITWKAPKNKEIFDVQKFKIDYPELAKKYIRYERQTRRLVTRFFDHNDHNDHNDRNDYNDYNDRNDRNDYKKENNK